MLNKMEKGEQAIGPMTFEALAEEALNTFAEIADAPEQQLPSVGQLSANSFASWNMLPAGRRVMKEIPQSVLDGSLLQEEVAAKAGAVMS